MSLFSHLTDVVSSRTTHWRAQPDLFVGSLLVEDVSTELGQLHRQHAVRQLTVSSTELLMILDQFAEPVFALAEEMLGQWSAQILKSWIPIFATLLPKLASGQSEAD